MKKQSKDSKQMLFEMMAKLNPDLMLNKSGSVSKKRRINEGWDDDPYGEVPDDDQYAGWDWDKNYNIFLYSDGGGKFPVEWNNLVYDDDERERLTQQLKTNSKDPELIQRITTLVDEFLISDMGQEFVWSYEQDYDGDGGSYDSGANDGYGTYGYEG